MPKYMLTIFPDVFLIKSPKWGPSTHIYNNMWLIGWVGNTEYHLSTQGSIPSMPILPHLLTSSHLCGLIFPHVLATLGPSPVSGVPKKIPIFIYRGMLKNRDCFKKK